MKTRPKLLAAAALSGAMMAVRELARPRPGQQARLIDWDVVRRRAVSGSGQKGPTHLVFSAADLGQRYDTMASEMRPWMEEALGVALHLEPFPPIQVVDRWQWIDVNLNLFRNLIDPVLKLQEKLPASGLTDIGRAGISHYLGAMLGFLSRRVLGQYDPVLLAPVATPATALYLVEPNIEDWEQRTGAPAEPLRRWLVLHEVTHAWEFEAHPWLRDHVNGLVREIIAHRLLAEDSPNRWQVLRMLTIGAREQWQAMSQIQAVMSLLEGFSNVMMRRVGRDHIKDYDLIDREFGRRSGQRTAVERAFFKITGLDLKMQQYVQGEQFCDAVIAKAGMEQLLKVWDGPESLPTLDEIHNPARWLARC